MRLSILLTTAVLAMTVMAQVAFAQATAEKSKSETTLSIGGTYSDGNSDQKIIHGSIVNTYTGDKDLTRIGAEGNYTKTDGSITADDAKIYANYKRVLDDRLYAVADASYLQDNIADVDYRFTLSPGLGYFLMKDDKATLSAEAGPGYLWEKVGGVEDDYWILRIAERYDRKLSDTAKCWQSLEYLPQIEDFDNYKINFEIGAEAVLTGPISIRLVAQDTYNSQPAPGKDENDLKVIGALAYTL
jgi:putative salt-induced outer membrane protein YdiY